MFQLCTRDEYGQVSILVSGPDIDALVTKAKTEVSNGNVENALTLDEQKKNWDTCFVEITDAKGKSLKNAYYAGKAGNGSDMIYRGKGEDLKEEKFVGSGCKMRFYIGDIIRDRKKADKTEMFAENAKKETVTEMKDMNLEGKTFYFIRRV
jgi:hypothetical protein